MIGSYTAKKPQFSTEVQFLLFNKEGEVLGEVGEDIFVQAFDLLVDSSPCSEMVGLLREQVIELAWPLWER